MKKLLFFALCTLSNLHAGDKKDSNSGDDATKDAFVALAAAKDQKKFSGDGYGVYNSKPIFALPKRSNHVRFLPDGETIVTDLQNELCLYPVKTDGECKLLGGEISINAIDCDRRSLLAAAVDKSKIILWNLNKLYARKAQWNGKGIGQVSTIKFDRGGKRVAVGDLEKCKMALYSVETQQELFTGHDETCDYVKDIVWSHDDSTLAACQPNGKPKISLWDTREQKSVAVVSVENRNIFGSPQMVCTADDTIIWNDRHKIKAWDRKTQKTREVAILSKEQRLDSNHYTSLALSHDDRVLAALCLKDQCDFLDWRTGATLQSLPLETNDNHCVTFSPQDDMIATTSLGNSWHSRPQVRVYEREKEKTSEKRE